MRASSALLAVASLSLASACSPAAEEAEDSALLGDAPETISSSMTGDDIPEGIHEAAATTIPGMVIAEVERKERDGMIFFDVEGARPDGSEVELDMLQGEDGSYTVMEIQRDIAWSDVPTEAKTVADAVDGMFTPVRVIESVQNDGRIIYELFADGTPEAPSAEISVMDGKAEMLTERWKY